MATTTLSEVKKGKKNSLLDWTKATLEDHKQRMVDLHRSWALTLAWTRGHQNHDFNKRTRKWEKSKRNEWQSRLISNFMLPLVRSKVSRYYSPRPLWDVIPATEDYKDIVIAKTSAKILQHHWVHKKLTKLMIMKSFWQSTCASCFIKVGWDTDAGEKVMIDPRGVDEQVLDDFLRLRGIDVVPEQVEVRGGDLFFDVVPPFNMCFDHREMLFEKSNFCIESNLRSMDWICNKYGNKWKEKLKETVDHEMLVHPYRYITNEDAQHINKKGILVHEVFIRPDMQRNMPAGTYAVIANDEILEAPRKEFPFNHGENPYAQFLEIFDPISPWGMCVADQVRSQQARYNKIQSTLTDHANLVGKVQWVIPRGANVKQLTNRPGEHIYYSGPRPPEQSSPANIPVYVENTLERTRRDMQDTSSFHNVSQGQSEEGVRSGRQVIALQDADDSVDAPIFGWEDDAIRRLGILALKTLNQYGTVEQVAKIKGEYGQLETIMYTGEMLQGDSSGDYFDVRVKTTSRNMLSRAGREQKIARYLELGILHPQQDRDIILEMLGSGDADLITDGLEPERTRQYKEIQMMKEGRPVPVFAGEAHGEHMKMIKRWMASGERDQVDERVVALVNDHYLKHLKMQAAEVAQQHFIAQAAAQGAINVNNANGQGQNSAGPGSPGGQPGQRLSPTVPGSLAAERGNESDGTGVGVGQ